MGTISRFSSYETHKHDVKLAGDILEAFNMENETNSRLHATVSGRVQGVSFRYFVLEQATELDLKGWVRNRWNGDVEVIAEGDCQTLEKLLSALRHGPRASHVSNVQVEWLPATGEFRQFYVRTSD